MKVKEIHASKDFHTFKSIFIDYIQEMTQSVKEFCPTPELHIHCRDQEIIQMGHLTDFQDIGFRGRLIVSLF